MLCARFVFVSFVTFVSVVPRTSGAQPAGELIERTLAIVAGQVITLSDVRTAVALGFVDAAGETPDVAAVTLRLIDRMLMLREVHRYAPPEPADAEIEGRMAIIKARFASPELFRRALQAGGFTEARVHAWIRDDLRITSYLNQRFADERRADLIADWIADLRRRTAVVELWRTKN